MTHQEDLFRQEGAPDTITQLFADVLNAIVNHKSYMSGSAAILSSSSSSFSLSRGSFFNNLWYISTLYIYMAK